MVDVSLEEQHRAEREQCEAYLKGLGLGQVNRLTALPEGTRITIGVPIRTEPIRVKAVVGRMMLVEYPTRDTVPLYGPGNHYERPVVGQITEWAWIPAKVMVPKA